MTAGRIYSDLDPRTRGYVDALVEHAASALWPERKEALASFYRGIAKSEGDTLRAALTTLGIEGVREEHRAETLFRVVLTAYLERLGEPPVTNPDQAALYSLSLHAGHVEAAERWLAEHPEHRIG